MRWVECAGDRIRMKNRPPMNPTLKSLLLWFTLAAIGLATWMFFDVFFFE
jgi:hypothetical protein